MARTNRSSGSVRVGSEEEFSETPRLLNDEEKRQLILAHAASRASKDPVQRATMWAGMFVALAVIVGGWWMSVGGRIQQGVSNTGEKDWKAMGEQLDTFTERLRTDPIVNAPNISTPTSAASAAEDIDMVQAVVGNGNAKAGRDDLMGPGGTYASTTSSDAPSDKPMPFEEVVDPNDPGLTPESAQ